MEIEHYRPSSTCGLALDPALTVLHGDNSKRVDLPIVAFYGSERAAPAPMSLDAPGEMQAAVRSELLPAEGRLLKFCTTRRSYFGPMAEWVLGERPRAWI